VCFFITVSKTGTPSDTTWKLEGTNTTSPTLYGTGSTTKTVSYAANPNESTRTISVTATCTQDTSISDTVSVSQSKKHVETAGVTASTDTSRVSSAAGTFIVDISVSPSTASWTAEGTTDGVMGVASASTLTPIIGGVGTGTGNGSIKVRYSANMGDAIEFSGKTLNNDYGVSTTALGDDGFVPILLGRSLTVRVTLDDYGVYDEVTVTQTAGKGDITPVLPSGSTGTTVTKYGVKLYFKDSTNRGGSGNIQIFKGYTGTIDDTTGSAAYQFTWDTSMADAYELIAERAPLSSSAETIYIGVWDNQVMRTTYYFNSSGTQLFSTAGSSPYPIQWSSINATATKSSDGTTMWKTIYANMSSSTYN